MVTQQLIVTLVLLQEEMNAAASGEKSKYAAALLSRFSRVRLCATP